MLSVSRRAVRSIAAPLRMAVRFNSGSIPTEVEQSTGRRRFELDAELKGEVRIAYCIVHSCVHLT